MNLRLGREKFYVVLKKSMDGCIKHFIMPLLNKLALLFK